MAALSPLSAEGTVARYLPLRGQGGLGDPALELVRSWIEDEDLRKIGHDVRDLHCLIMRENMQLRGVVGDTRLASFLIDPTRDIPHRLDQICRSWLHRTLPSRKDLVGSGKKLQSVEALSLERVSDYACHLVSTVAEAWPLLAAALVDEGQSDNLQQLSLPMAEVLARMQLAGVRVDADELERLGVGFEARKKAVEAEIHEIAGRKFNIGSPKQLGEVLFDEMGIPVVKRTKTGYSTAADVLEKLAPQYPIAKLVMDQRALAKLINTYIRVLQEAIGEDGRVHCTFQQTAGMPQGGSSPPTRTSSERRFEQKTGSAFGRRFCRGRGGTMMSADWSQIELRILAHMSGDEVLVDSYTRGIDVHRRTAGEIFGIPTQVRSTRSSATSARR